MIRIDRSKVPLPPDVAGKLATDRDKLLAFYKGREEGRKAYQQRPFNFDSLRLTRPTLKELFENKCAYCETPLTGQHGDVDNFRPKETVEEVDGQVRRDGYWWLALDWDNIYLTCANCNRLHKRNQFPVAGTRAEPFARGLDLLSERPLLLDPCYDDPPTFLSFEADGQVTSRPATQDAMKRADTTIAVLGLNRKELIESRRRVRQFVESVSNNVLRGLRGSGFIRELVEPGKPHIGAAQQWLIERARTLSARDRTEIERRVVEMSGISREALAAVQAFSTARPRSSRPKTGRVKEKHAPIIPPEGLAAQSVFIKRISIRNFKAIRKLDLALPTIEAASAEPPVPGFDASQRDTLESSTRTGWFVLLGENAVGKSSVLEAIALAAMGAPNIRTLVRSGVLPLKKLVHIKPDGTNRRGARTATIRLTLEPEEFGEIELRITRSSFSFTKGGGLPLRTLLRGYGFVRLFSAAGEQRNSAVNLARCDNLFNPRLPLCDVDTWMTSLPYDARSTSSFDIAARTILTLLPKAGLTAADAGTSAADTHLTPDNGRVVVHFNQRTLALDQLSSGYQSVIALAADIMAGIPADKLFDMRQASGVVLVDEIGTQLHPRWRMHAIDDLRRAFPGMQFIATTHEPLCLKGVAANEVAVLRRDHDHDEVIALTEDLPDPRALRVDQLLTSPMFGLDSTIDPAIDQLFQRYFALVAAAKNGGLDAAAEAERRRLEEQLAPHRGLGYTRSDQLVYALLDEFLATQGLAARKRALRVPARTKKQVFDIWRNAVARRGSA